MTGVEQIPGSIVPPDAFAGAEADRRAGEVGPPAEPTSVLLAGHDVPLGRYTTVRRLLPQRARRMVGARCFVDHFGPDDVAERPGMQVPDDGHGRLPLDPGFEHGVLVMSGAAEVAGVRLTPGSLLYLGTGRCEIDVRGLGGAPFEEPLVMWWNFVGRSHEEIAQDREDWMAGRRFPTVAGDPAERLPAPPMPTTRLKARTRDGASGPA